MWADLDGSGSLTTRYVHGDAVDQLFARVSSSDVNRWYLVDHQGSIRNIVDNAGASKDALAYDAFGNIVSETNSAERGRYAWTSREIDTETGLQYNRARYYDATTGRWISQDPMGFDAGDSNLYRYVQNHSLDQFDPSGLTRRVIEIYNNNNAEFFGTSSIVPPTIQAKVQAIFDAAIKASTAPAGSSLSIQFLPRTPDQLEKMSERSQLGWNQTADGTTHDNWRWRFWVGITGIGAPAFSWTSVNTVYVKGNTLRIQLLLDTQSRLKDALDTAIGDNEIYGESDHTKNYFSLKREAINRGWKVWNTLKGKAKCTYDDFVAHVIAHELGWHILGKKGNVHDTASGFIDSSSVDLFTTFSKTAIDLMVQELHF